LKILLYRLKTFLNHFNTDLRHLKALLYRSFNTLRHSFNDLCHLETIEIIFISFLNAHILYRNAHILYLNAYILFLNKGKSFSNNLINPFKMKLIFSNFAIDNSCYAKIIITLVKKLRVGFLNLITLGAGSKINNIKLLRFNIVGKNLF
jgi:hypothetical protein